MNVYLGWRSKRVKIGNILAKSWAKTKWTFSEPQYVAPTVWVHLISYYFSTHAEDEVKEAKYCQTD